MSKKPSLMDKLIGVSSSKLTTTLATSTILNDKDMIQTLVPSINIALSGSLDGGMQPGLLQIAGPSKHFKTLFGLIMMRAYLDKYPDAVGYLFDSEFGAALTYFEAMGIDDTRVIHCPIEDIEQLKHEAMLALTAVDRGDKVFFFVDSVGNLASKKETEDALDGKSVADMTRAKALKSLGRLITPKLTLKDVPMVMINHTYDTMEMFSKKVVSGGTGLYYSANDIWIIGRQQEKGKDKELLGFNFDIIIEKSRMVQEKSKIPVTVTFEGGIQRLSGIADLAEEFGVLSGDGKAGYSFKGVEGVFKKPAELKVLDGHLEQLLNDEEFKEWVKKKYRVSNNKLLQTV